MAETVAIGEKQVASVTEPPLAYQPPQPEGKKPLRVCVLNASYEGSDSSMKDYDDLNVGPHHYFPKDDPDFTFEVHSLKKATAYRQVRALAKSGRFDVFYNMCDGCKDEDRAGVEVVQALEEFKVPFTGCLSKWYEISKPDLKMIAFYNKILTPRSAVVESRQEAERKCSGLRFPLLIKHPSGYSSVGMTRDCKCWDMESLLNRLDLFLEEYQQALIEEFIAGEECTVLSCADETCEDGVRVFQPVMINFPEGEDFKHFDLKWVAFEGMEWAPVPTTHKAYRQIIDIGRKAFKEMMGGFGYGRTDIRIDSMGNAYFLEINTYPGMMYPPGQEASSDWIMKLEPGCNHRRFAMLQMKEAFNYLDRTTPCYYRDFDPIREYHLRAARPIPKGQVILADEGRPHRIYTKPFVDRNWTEEQKKGWGVSAWPLGRDHHVYAVWDTDPSKWRSYNHSCEPNMAFDVNRSLNTIALRDIAKGEELTMDYTTFMDSTAMPFTCNCGSDNCRKLIQFKSVPKGLLVSPAQSAETASVEPSEVSSVETSSHSSEEVVAMTTA